MNGRQLAEALQVSQAHVSRLRSGERLPSMSLMWGIESVLGWTTGDQMISIRAQTFHEELVKRLDADEPADTTPEQQEVKA